MGDMPELETQCRRTSESSATIHSFARNLAFSVLVFGELLRAFASRDLDRPFWEVGVFTNLKLLGVVALSVLVQLGIHHIPATQHLFHIGALSLEDCVLSLALGCVPLVALECAKLVRRHRWGRGRRAD